MEKKEETAILYANANWGDAASEKSAFYHEEWLKDKEAFERVKKWQMEQSNEYCHKCGKKNDKVQFPSCGIPVTCSTDGMVISGHENCPWGFPDIKPLPKALPSEWISVEDKPLYTKDDNGNLTCTEEGNSEFIAAVPTNTGWWIRHCVVEDSGLAVVGDCDNDVAGWELEDISHYFLLPKLNVELKSSPKGEGFSPIPRNGH